MEGNHPVKQKIVLTFGDDFGLAILGDEDGEMTQVSPNKIPNPVLCSRFESKAAFKAMVWLVR